LRSLSDRKHAEIAENQAVSVIGRSTQLIS